MKNRTWLSLFLAAVVLAGCAPKVKTENTAVSALRKEKNAWEQESNNVAGEATQTAESAASESKEDTDAVQ